MKRTARAAVILLGLVACFGCKSTAKRIVVGILQPDRSSGAINPIKPPDADTPENQSTPTPNGATFLNPTACDPTDADGDPNDDICPPNPPSPPSPS